MLKPKRGNRYYRCLRYGTPEAYALIHTVHCPHKQCQRNECSNYIPPGTVPRGRPASPITVTPNEKRAKEKGRLADYREMLSLTPKEKFEVHVKPEAVEDAQKTKEVPHVLQPGYKPSKGSKYSTCELFKKKPFVCKVPRRLCTGCEHHTPRKKKRQGRTKGSGMYDWNDPNDVREYHRDYMRDKRASQ